MLNLVILLTIMGFEGGLGRGAGEGAAKYFVVLCTMWSRKAAEGS